MTTLNRAACEAMVEIGVHAATDVTGFGLLGHLRNIVAASKCTAVVRKGRVPMIEAAKRYVAEGIAPGGTHANVRFLAEWVDFGGASKEEELLLCDAQTSGGLLIAVSEEKSERLVRALQDRGTSCAAIVGHFEEGPARIAVRA